MLHTPILGQRHVAIGAGLFGALGGFVHGGTQFRGNLLARLWRQQCLVLAGRLSGVRHAGGVQAGVIAGTFPERQQVGLHTIAHVLNHGLGVLSEVAHTRFDVRASNGHAVHQQLGVDTAVERAQLLAHALAGGGHLVGGKQLVVGKAVCIGSFGTGLGRLCRQLRPDGIIALE